MVQIFAGSGRAPGRLIPLSAIKVATRMVASPAAAIVKLAEMERYRSPVELDLDPDGLFNPGKVLP
jgi:FAD/FMN-containing dehydrogenase